jgi:outer membrane receptor protein involved in Fe transport
MKTGSAGSYRVTPVYQYRSRQYFDDDNTRFGGTLRQDGFGLVNVRAAWRSANRRWSVEAFVENAFDQGYLIDAGNFGANYNIPTFIRGDPRIYGLSATVRL